MRKRFCLLFFASALYCSQALAYDFVVVTVNNRFYGISIENCEATLLANLGLFSSSFTDITYTPDGRLWATTSSGQIYEIDLDTGGFTLEFSLPFPASNAFITGMVADQNGLIYLSGGNGGLYTYDPATGDWSTLGIMFFSSAGDLTFVDGELVMAATQNMMVQVDRSNPAESSPLFDFPINSPVFGVVTYAASCDEEVTYATTAGNSGNIYQIDFDNASLELVCSINTTIYGAASELEFLAAAPLEINGVGLTEIDCENPFSTLEVDIEGGNGAVSYSLNGQSFQSSNTFTGLSPGTYTVEVEDEFGCTDELEIEVPQGETVPRLADLMVEDDHCGLGEGRISFNVEGGVPPFTFSLNGGAPQSEASFTGLPQGSYSLLITDSEDCPSTEQVVIGGNPPMQLSGEAVACGPGQSWIELAVSGGTGLELQYQLGNGGPQNTPRFDGLSAGSYLAVAQDNENCRDTLSINVPDGVKLDVELEQTRACGPGLSSIVFSVQNGTPPLTYLMNGTPQASGNFNGLSGGDYTLQAEDGRGCRSDELEITLPTVKPLGLDAAVEDIARCGRATGAIVLSATGGTPPYSYTAGGQSQASAEFFNLPPGLVALLLQDDQGCALQDTVLIPSDCPVFIPSAFSPNGDGRNDRFEVFSGQAFEVVHYRIYDRWGGMLYEATNFPGTDRQRFWDGRAQGAAVNSGLYVYQIEIIKLNGERAAFSGELSLIR